MLQDYAYILKGNLPSLWESTGQTEIMIKIPMDAKSEFESQYSIDDLLIGHVSVVGIYKGIVEETFISSNTFSYWQEAGSRQKSSSMEASKIIKSNSPVESGKPKAKEDQAQYHFIDTLAVIQDVAFDYEAPAAKKVHWWNRIGLWLSRLGRK